MSTPSAVAPGKGWVGLSTVGAGLVATGALAAALAWLAGWPGVGLGGRWLALAGLCLVAARRRSLTSWILVSMVVGAELGHDWPGGDELMRVLSQIFIRLIKTIIAPLLFATLVVGIAGHPNLRQRRAHGRQGPRLLRGRHDARALHRPRRDQRLAGGRGHRAARGSCSRRPRARPRSR